MDSTASRPARATSRPGWRCGMTPARCSRLWEVEAIRDGRLPEAAADSLRAHAKTCPACREEATSLHALNHRLRNELCRVDEVSSRRLRRRLLERVARSMRNDGMRQVFRSLSLVFVLAGAAWLLYIATRDPERKGALPLIVTASPGGVFLRESERGIERVIVRDGTVTFGVERGPEDPRLVVQVPDGEISDL